MRKKIQFSNARLLSRKEQQQSRGGCTPYCGSYCYLKCKFGEGGPSYTVMEIPGCAYSENYCELFFGMVLDGCYCESSPSNPI